MKSSVQFLLAGIFLLAGSALLTLPASRATLGKPPAAQPATPQKLLIHGPDVLQRGTRHLLYVQGFYDGKGKRLAPDQFSVKVTGPARAVDDPAGKPMNPFEVKCDDVEKGKVTVEVRVADKAVIRVFPVGTAPAAGTFEAVINPTVVSHRFAGLGGGVLFYDNQFDITKKDDIYDWCFRDVRTTFLHVLIRPGYLPKDPKEDWRSVDLAKFDFSPLERPFRIIKKARERNPDLKIYASLYSPPAWMKTNNSTSGKGSLKDGLRYRQELARYVFAYVKYAQRQGIPIHYLSFFNEPDFPHTQEGMFFADLGVLVETFHACTKALDTLIAADSEVKQAPVYVFPDTLGPGAITRSGQNSLKVRERQPLLQRVGVWGVHDYWNQAGTYWNERYRELRAFPGVGAKPIWMTEWAQRERYGDLASGVEYGSKILNALRLGAEAWMVFEWCHPSGNQSGLISTNFGAKAPQLRYWRSKAYHIFRQVANTTPAGAQVVSMTGRWKGVSQANGRGVEYLALRDGENLIVHLMNTEPAAVHYRLTVPRPLEKTAGWTTTPLDDLALADAKLLTVSRQSNSSTISGVVPGNSLLSFVLKGKKAP